ncbi:MAG: isopenicillin N synthase family dioxygenase [Ilumatobacteraceae bacterium]
MSARVPVVDIGPFAAGGDTERRAIATAVDTACREVGFFTVIGHGVPAATLDSTWAAAIDFFDLPLEQRMTVVQPRGYPYGYNPLNAEALNRSIGGDAPPDLKETFNVGPIDPPPRPIEEMDDVDERAVFAPNLWPDDVCPALRPAVEAHYRAMTALAERLMEIFAVALGLPDRWFAPFIDRHGSAMRLAHYPALDRAPIPGQLRAGAHTDYGTLTILAIDDEPGLQVQAVSGEWVDVHPVDGGLVVNLGDLMQRWTNDRWRSTMHRVVVPHHPTDLSASDEASVRLTHTERGIPAELSAPDEASVRLTQTERGSRLSVPFFHNANWDAEVVCLTAPGEAPRHPPVTAGRHLMAKFRSTVT